MTTDKKIIVRRALRWSLISFLIGIAPFVISYVVTIIFSGQFNGFLMLIKKYLEDGTFIVIGLTIQGAKFIDFSYARDFDYLNNRVNSWITVPFLLNAIFGVILYTYLNLIETIKLHEIIYIPIIISTSINFIVSILHTIYLQWLLLRYYRDKNELYLPTIDGEMNCENCKTYHRNYFKRKKKIKISEKSVLYDEFAGDEKG